MKFRVRVLAESGESLAEYQVGADTHLEAIAVGAQRFAMLHPDKHLDRYRVQAEALGAPAPRPGPVRYQRR